MKGKFIVIDGIDGSGTTTQTQSVANYLFTKNKEYDVLLTREPSNSVYGREIRNLLKEEGDPKEKAEKFLNLYVSDRKDHINNIIEPALNKGIHVISDRYSYSTIAYQHAQGISINEILELHEGLLVPDLAIILDVDVGTALKRINKDKELFEKKEFLELVRENYKKQINQLGGNSSEPILLIDGSQSKEIVTKEIISTIEGILKL